MKGICYTWSRGRHFSPSMPGDRYLKLGSKTDLRGEISGSIVWYNALTTSRGTVVLVFIVGMRSFPGNEILTILAEKVSAQGQLNPSVTLC